MLSNQGQRFFGGGGIADRILDSVLTLVSFSLLLHPRDPPALTLSRLSPPRSLLICFLGFYFTFYINTQSTKFHYDIFKHNFYCSASPSPSTALLSPATSFLLWCQKGVVVSLYLLFLQPSALLSMCCPFVSCSP